jgi:spore coat protein U-like protein
MCAVAAAETGAATCAVGAVSLAFGGYNPFRSAHTDANGSISVTCNGASGELITYAIALNAGGSGVFGMRTMRYGAAYALNYNLYTSAARSMVWGDGNAGTMFVTDSFTLSGSQVTRNYPVYGRVFSRQNLPVGNYTDSIVVTLSF